MVTLKITNLKQKLAETNFRDKLWRIVCIGVYAKNTGWSATFQHNSWNTLLAKEKNDSPKEQFNLAWILPFPLHCFEHWLPILKTNTVI